MVNKPRAIINTSLSWFERCVILYGKQAAMCFIGLVCWFERCVILYGKQAKAKHTHALIRLRGV